MGSTSPPGHIVLVSEGPRVRPAVPGDSGPGTRAHRVDRPSRANRARVRGPVGSTSCSGELGPGSEELRSRPAFPRDTGPFPRACVVDQLSRETRDLVGRPAVSTSLPGRLRPLTRDRGVHQLSRATRTVTEARVSNSCPGRLAHVSEGPRGQPAFPGVSCPGRGIAGMITQSGVTRASARWPAVSTKSRATRVLFRGPAVYQVSWATRAHARRPAV